MELKYGNDYIEKTASRHSCDIFYNDSHNVIKYNRVDDIIQKYKPKNTNSNPKLNMNVGNHALIIPIVRNQNSVQNYQNYTENKSTKCENDEVQLKNNIMNFRCERNNHYINKFTCSDARLTSNEKVYHDKTTYCRPVLNYYNEQFIYKTMERNSRLKNLVKKLAIARQREKETVNWNNFINDLETRHGLNFDNRKYTSINKESKEYITPEIINDYYKTRFSFVQSKPCRHLLQDFYGAFEPQSNYTYDRYDDNRLRKFETNSYLPYERDPYCYPTASQGRLRMERRRREKQFMNQRDDINRTISYKNVTCKRNNTEIRKNFRTINKFFYHNDLNQLNITTTSAVQTDTKFYPDFISNFSQDKATYKTDDSHRSQVDIKKASNSLKQISLMKKDTKLEMLIESINTFLDEIKFNKANRRKNKHNNYFGYKDNDKDEIINQIESDAHVRNATAVINDLTNDISENTIIVSDSGLGNLHSSAKIYKYLREIDKHSSKSIELYEKYRNRPCSVQIDFQVPTKDNTTEITKSLSKQDFEDKEAINLSTQTFQRMTIAVNTDPLSLLGLIRISSDTIRQLLSYMPNIDYYSYLSLLQFPKPRRVESHYICNICGADFSKPSQLSDHIRGHDLGKTKDCGVCRHVLDLARKNPGLFRCRYCGQLFARAYCCELHMESCAKRFGKRHDIDSNLVLLR